MVTGQEPIGPAPNRIYETSVGPIHATFATSVVVLTRVPPDGWIPRLGRGRTAGRSPSATADTLVDLGVPVEETEDLGAAIIHDWAVVEVPTRRSRVLQLRDLAGIVAIFLRLLAALPRFAWDLRGEGAADESPTDLIPPASSEYGVLRLVKTSRGWTQFEFWGAPEATVGVYREDGWLPMSTLDHFLDEPGVADALERHGLAREEAERTASLVFEERRARTGAAPSP